ncbi:MAG: UrcA family protein [Pseudomonadota bacterium]
MKLMIIPAIAAAVFAFVQPAEAKIAEDTFVFSYDIKDFLDPILREAIEERLNREIRRYCRGAISKRLLIRAQIRCEHNLREAVRQELTIRHATVLERRYAG